MRSPSRRSAGSSTFPEVRLWSLVKRPLEERQPVTDERRLGGVVEQRPYGLVRAVALEQEDDLGLGHEDGVSVQGFLELLAAESRVLGEQRLSSLLTAGCQAGDKDEAIHG